MIQIRAALSLMQPGNSPWMKALPRQLEAKDSILQQKSFTQTIFRSRCLQALCHCRKGAFDKLPHSFPSRLCMTACAYLMLHGNCLIKTLHSLLVAGHLLAPALQLAAFQQIFCSNHWPHQFVHACHCIQHCQLIDWNTCSQLLRQDDKQMLSCDVPQGEIGRQCYWAILFYKG